MVGGELGRTLMMLAMMMRWRICQTVQLRWSTRLISPGDKYCRLVVDRGDDGAGGGGGDGGTVSSAIHLVPVPLMLLLLLLLFGSYSLSLSFSLSICAWCAFSKCLMPPVMPSLPLRW